MYLFNAMLMIFECMLYVMHMTTVCEHRCFVCLVLHFTEVLILLIRA